MNGTVIRLVERAKFNYDNVAANSDVSTPLATRVDISGYEHVTLQVKVFVSNIGGSGSDILGFTLFPDGTEDWQSMVNTQAGAELASIALDNSTVDTIYADEADKTRLPSHVALYVTGIMSATPTNLNAEVTVDLVLRNAR